VPFTLPGQLYDVDPSRSNELSRVSAEVSGSGPRPFDAGYTPRCQLYSLEVVRPFERWLVLGRTGGDFSSIAFADLGLSAERDYLVYEFWTERFLGAVKGAFDPGSVDNRYRCQVFVLRERLDRPQLVSTSRHITGGGVDVRSLAWHDPVMEGESMVVAGDRYTITCTEPEGYHLVAGRTEPDTPVVIRRSPGLVRVEARPVKVGTLRWTLTFSRTHTKEARP
jgi:hypothetical protein